MYKVYFMRICIATVFEAKTTCAQVYKMGCCLRKVTYETLAFTTNTISKYHAYRTLQIYM